MCTDWPKRNAIGDYPTAGNIWPKGSCIFGPHSHNSCLVSARHGERLSTWVTSFIFPAVELRKPEAMTRSDSHPANVFRSCYLPCLAGDSLLVVFCPPPSTSVRATRWCFILAEGMGDIESLALSHCWWPSEAESMLSSLMQELPSVTQGLRLPRWALYHSNHSTSPIFCAENFQDRVLETIYPGLALNSDPPDLCLLSS
jgi:hypothetical protein